MGTLHKKILQEEWEDVTASLVTDAGKRMARDQYKGNLPLHMAIGRKAPDSTILSLLHAHPEAAAQTGRFGGTSLHMAAQQERSPPVLIALIRAFPEALDKKDNNCRLPSDYFQQNEISREALTRPSLCWIENIEKEEFYDKVSQKRVNLWGKIEKLKDSLEESKERRTKLKKGINNFEVMLRDKESVVRKLGDIEKEITKKFQLQRVKLKEIESSIEILSKEVSVDPSEEEIMMRSLMKRTYMQGVQRQYEKIRECMDQIKMDIDILDAFRRNN